MHLPKEIRQRLAQEFRFAAGKMKETEDPFRKLYFFSAFYGETARALNWVWDRDLVLLHTMCQHAHQQIHARLQSVITGGERVVRPPGALYEALTQVADDLAQYVAQEPETQSLSDLLGRLAELNYLATGNGYYLYEKGLIKL